MAPLIGGLLNYPVELARVFCFPAGALRWRHLQHGALDAGSPPCQRAARLIANYKTFVWQRRDHLTVTC